MKYLLFIAVLMFVGCNEDHKDKNSEELKIRIKEDILDKDKERTAKFILECAKNANPMSDEEGEDLVAQCDRTADSLFAEDRYVVCIDSSCFSYKYCDDVTLKNEIKACEKNGWVRNETSN